MTPPCAIAIVNEHPDPPHLDLDLLQRAVDYALIDEDLEACSLTILLVDREQSGALHQQHFDVTGATDVMTFPDGSHDPEQDCRHLGDLAVCPDVARDVASQHVHQADEQDLRAQHECLLYIIHGLLHILGYDDQDPADRQEMWDRQFAICAAVGINVTRDD